MNDKTIAAPAIPVARYALWLVLLAAAGTFALTMGVRQTMGLFLSSLNTSTGLGIGSISLAFAFGQLWWGLTQPFAGAVADRIGTGRVIVIGVLLVALGTIITPLMTTTGRPDLRDRRAGRGRRRHGRPVRADGRRHAHGAAGQARPGHRHRECRRLVRPVRDGADRDRADGRRGLGQRDAMARRADPARAACGVRAEGQLQAAGGPVGRGERHEAADGAREAIGQALATPSYRYLSLGFLVCGFHVAFLATHLPGVVAACGLPPEIGGWALGVIGLFNIVGSLAMGWAVGRWRMKSLLALLYATRGIAVLIFLLAPKTPRGDAGVRGGDGHHLPLDRAADRGPGRQDVRSGQHGDAVRHRDAVRTRSAASSAPSSAATCSR